MQEHINNMINMLQHLRDELDKQDDIESRIADLNAEHAHVSASLAKAKEDLAAAKSGHAVTQLKNQKEHDEVIFAKRKEIEALDIKLDKLRQDVAEGEVKVKGVQALHSQIEQSIESLRKKLG